ncbi:NAD(P)H-hydrate dehydratase [Pokkaliibacter sp. CJK22405]|uniref:NAD(P)H-hydrate dehydratase n=1 Tax=Pokkaliibacter sp. CJK22405 TaxID=3384615 RepID=UPI0039848D02
MQNPPISSDSQDSGWSSKLFEAQSLKRLDELTASERHLSGFSLMQEAATALLRHVQQHWPGMSHLSIVAGAGNNGGDGVALARLALEAGFRVQLILSDEPNAWQQSLKGEAAEAWQWLQSSSFSALTIGGFSETLAVEGDLLIDALLGIGIQGAPRASAAAIIRWMNSSQVPVLAVDVPSGVNADTGHVVGEAVIAARTLSFIAMKPGLLTGTGVAHAGVVSLADLGAATINSSRHAGVKPQGRVFAPFAPYLPHRSADSHKGQFGHVLVVGGNLGMAGAALLSARAALRSGAGLVSVVTRETHVPAFITAQPELMVKGVRNGLEAIDWMTRCDVILIGPGLGQDAWAEQLLQQALAAKKPLVIDADALTLLKQRGWQPQTPWVMTPHPGEAARLLDVANRDIQADRLFHAKALQQQYHAVVVLKGKGSWVVDKSELPRLVTTGNPGMSAPGMGDALAGVIAALMGQGFSGFEAASLGAYLHGVAGDEASKGGQRGMVTSDLIEQLRPLVNA